MARVPPRLNELVVWAAGLVAVDTLAPSSSPFSSLSLLLLLVSLRPIKLAFKLKLDSFMLTRLVRISLPKKFRMLLLLDE